jgi:carbonic anhydrase
VLEYASAQYHIHIGSEHRIDGVQYAMELHLVHTLYGLFQNALNISVIGMLFQIDENATTNLFDQINFTQNQTINFKTVLTPLLAYPAFHYEGSLTTPTCGEFVNWYVMQQVYPIRQAQLTAIASIINNGQSNARNAQSLNGRNVSLISPSCNLGMPTIHYNLLTISYAGLLKITIAFLFGLLTII